MSYESFKKFLIKHRPQFYLAGAFILIFFVGVGTGKLGAAEPKASPASYSNYSTKPLSTTPSPTPQVAGVAAPIVSPSPVEATAAEPVGECVVKGTASSKIYHMSGGAFYERLKNPRCFKSEADAIAAGFRKSSR
jgi:hypothetical protein